MCPLSTGVAYIEANFQTRTDGMWRLWNVLIVFGFYLLCLGLTIFRMARLKPQGYRYLPPVNAIDPDERSCPRISMDHLVRSTSSTNLPGATAVRIGTGRDMGATVSNIDVKADAKGVTLMTAGDSSSSRGTCWSMG